MKLQALLQHYTNQYSHKITFLFQELYFSLIIAKELFAKPESQLIYLQ